LTTLQSFREKLARENSTPALFVERPRLYFRSARTHCPDCQAPLQVAKTQTKTVHTLPVGCFTAHQTLLACGDCQNSAIYRAEELSQLVPAGCTFGFDVLVFVGKGLFLRHRQAREIVEELAGHNVRLSASQVDYLGKKFVVYLALAHRQGAPRLRKAMRQQGGYVLHLDGTCEGGGPMLMSSLDSLSQIVLGNVKVPSEKTEQIIPFLQELKARYGKPVAVVHDMGRGILAAVKEVFPGVPDFICHFHFLRDLGKDLLAWDYDQLRQRLRQYGLTEKLLQHARRLKTQLDEQPEGVERFCQSVQDGSLPAQELELFPIFSAYSLIQWTLAGKTQGEGYGFPFDRPLVHLAKRLRRLGQELEQIKDIHLRGQWRDNIPLFKLALDLKKISTDKGLLSTLEAIDLKGEVFDQLRGAMRIAETGQTAGLNSGSNPIALHSIKKAVEQFRKKVIARPDYSSSGHWRALVEQIDKYGDKLFADPITVKTKDGTMQIFPQRTNNLMERFFRDLRRGARRKCGHNSISRFLQSMIADTPLVRNLENPNYLKILLDGQATLEDRFAKIQVQTVRKELHDALNAPEKVPSKIRQLIHAQSFPETICRLFKKAA
jgi:hypothetical protein